MSKEKSQQKSRLIKINLLSRLTIVFSLILGILTFIFTIVLIRNEKNNFNDWLNKSMYSSLDAINNIYTSTRNEDYDIEYVWGKLMNDFSQLDLLENDLSTDELNALKQNLSTNIEKTIFASFNYFIRNERYLIKGFPFVVSQKGEVLIHPTDEGENYSDNLFFQDVISTNANTGELSMQWPENRLGEKRKLYYKKNENNGFINFVSLNENDYVKYINQYKSKITLLSIVFYILIVLLFVLLVNPVILNIKAQTKATEQLFDTHKIPETKPYFDDEIYTANLTLRKGQNYLNHISGFIGQLKNQNYNVAKLDSVSDKLLAKELYGLTDELKKIQTEEQKRKEELDVQNWIATGIAKFNDVLRKSSNLKEMGYDIVSTICDYMDINQAAVYNVERNERTKAIEVIKLIAAYAFDRHRTINKTLTPGEGLVGAAIKETKSIYLDKIPEDYINITSGLGEAVPSHLLIIPLKKEEEILGALELASFNKFKDHEVKFLERLSQTFAISISNILVSDNTNKLLNETKEQAEQMASQEEEMRQTLEELQATQDEMQRKTKQMEDMNKQHEQKEKELESTIAELKKIIEEKEREIEKLKS